MASTSISASASLQPWNEKAPKSSYAYDPGVYDAPDPQVATPQITPPPPSSIANSPAPTAPAVVPGTKGARTASIAYGLDAILRGAMKGREQAQQQQAYKANRLLQGFQYAYQSASSQYLGMLQNDPELAGKLGELNSIASAKSPTPEQQARAKELASDPGVQKAQSVAAAADSAWAAQQRIYGNYLGDGSGKKPKSKSKAKGGDQSPGTSGSPGGDGENPVQLIQSQNPQDKLRGFLAITQAAGPSYKREAQYLMSPEYQNQRRLITGEQQLAGDIQAKRLELHKLQNADPSTMDDKSRQRLAQLQEDPELFPQLMQRIPHVAPVSTPGSALVNTNDPRTGLPITDKLGHPIDPKLEYRQETTGNESAWIPVISKPVKSPNKDEHYIGILEKQMLGTPLTDEDKAYAGAYQLYTKQTKIDPAIARAAAYGANRYVPVLDPNNPENVIYMKAAEAAKSEAGTPQSISFQIDRAITKAFTSGQPATNINFFNTAVDHLTLLEEASQALHNHDVQGLNRIGNAIATATGQPAPTDFNAVRNAVAGELAKTFTGARATKEEIALMNKTISDAQSPEQLANVTEYYKRLMAGKLNALKSQYDAGKSGQPAFKNDGAGAPVPSLDEPTGTASDGKSPKKKRNPSPSPAAVDPNDPAGIL